MRACRLAHFSRAARYRRSRARDQSALRLRIRDLAHGLRLFKSRERLEALLQDATAQDVFLRRLPRHPPGGGGGFQDHQACHHADSSGARFPFVKSLDTFDFSYQPSLDQKQIQTLSSCHFIEHGENVVLFGPPASPTWPSAGASGAIECGLVVASTGLTKACLELVLRPVGVAANEPAAGIAALCRAKASASPRSGSTPRPTRCSSSSLLVYTPSDLASLFPRQSTTTLSPGR